MTATVSAPSKGGEYLAFRLGAEEYGIDILCVQEIRSYEQPTRIENGPTFLKGVIGLRGEMVPIVDLRLKLRVADGPYDHLTVVVILVVRGRTIGAVVDSVSDVWELSADQVKPVENFPASDEVRLIKYVAAVDERVLLIMDIEALMTENDMKLLPGA